MVKNLFAMQETQVQSPGLGRYRGEENGQPLHYLCLQNPMDRGAWQATVHRITKRWTRLSNSHFHFNIMKLSAYVFM